VYNKPKGETRIDRAQRELRESRQAKPGEVQKGTAWQSAVEQRRLGPAESCSVKCSEAQFSSAGEAMFGLEWNGNAVTGMATFGRSSQA
jgi:hypothetical protein